MAVGIKIGTTNFNFDENIIETNTPNDLAFSFDDEGKFLYNIGFGLYYHRPLVGEHSFKALILRLIKANGRHMHC